jgi:hypothetical protein
LAGELVGNSAQDSVFERRAEQRTRHNNEFSRPRLWLLRLATEYPERRLMVGTAGRQLRATAAKENRVTFVIAKITDRDAGQVSMLADTKLTDKNDDTLNRRTLANPSQKVVIVDDDVVIGFAGDTPQSALRQVVALRGQSVGTIEKALRS